MNLRRTTPNPQFLSTYGSHTKWRAFLLTPATSPHPAPRIPRPVFFYIKKHLYNFKAPPSR